MTYLYFPPGGATGPCLSHSRFILCSRERFNSSQSLVFDAPRSRIKVMWKRSSASAPPAVVLHTLLLHFVDFPHLLSSVLRWMSAGEAVAEFNLRSSAFLHHVWRTCSHMNYLFHPAQFLQRVWHLLDELVFLTVKTLSIFSAPRFFLFQMVLSWILMTLRFSSFFFHL